jgi:hypothetical protein
MKWTWDKFGYNVPRELTRDPDLILALLNLASERSACVSFFPDFGRAIVTSKLDISPSREELIRASRECDWDIDYYSEDGLNAIQSLAKADLGRIELINSEFAAILIQNGAYSLDDVSVLPPERLAALLNVDTGIADEMIVRADEICDTDEEAK